MAEVSKKIQEIIGRALTDEAFANDLGKDPKKALESYKLTPQEFDVLRNLQKEKIKDFASALDARVSKGAGPWGSEIY